MALDRSNSSTLEQLALKGLKASLYVISSAAAAASVLNVTYLYNLKRHLNSRLIAQLTNN